MDFTGNDGGMIEISQKGASEDEFIRRLYSRNLDEALHLFAGDSVEWIDRRLSDIPESQWSPGRDDRKYISPEDLIGLSGNACVLAPAEYGLTSLGHYLCLKALDSDRLGFLLCLKKLRPYAKEMLGAVKSELEVLKKTVSDLDFLLIDSWSEESVKDKKKALQEIRKAFPSTRLIFLQTSNVGAAGLMSGIDSEIASLGVDSAFYLYALNREAIRYGVRSYSVAREIKIGNEDVVVSKVIEDFNFLNLPRTPMNCFTLLTVLEANYQDSLLNRGDMVSKILVLIFGSVDLPSYSRIPDAKDCEYIMGFFCAEIIRTRMANFERSHFITFCREICERKFFDIDAAMLFEVLLRNRIIIKSGMDYCFRFTYWVNYFSAMNMKSDASFREHILSGGGYISHPEIIEFYTGHDRSREDALAAIKRDIDEALVHIREKVGEGGFFPYGEFRWVMNDEQRASVADHLEREVFNSNLPTKVKDEYSDQTYDPSRPYFQTVNQVLGLTSMRSLMNLVTAAGKALRNSDFADVQLRLSLLSSFVKGLVQINRVLVLISSLLSKSGRASFDDTGFQLIGGNWVEGIIERQFQIIQAAPGNIINWYAVDIYSEKIGPLISAAVESEKDGLVSMFLVCIAAKNRSSGWEKLVETYIRAEPKESFGLWMVFETLSTECKYGYHDGRTAERLAYLTKMCIAKHKGATSLGKDKVSKISLGFLDRKKP